MEDDAPRFHAGQRFVCEHCGDESVVKVRREMSGWECVREHYACALCGADLGDVAEDAAGEEHAAAKEKLGKLADFLGEAVVERPRIEAEEANFCRDCANFLKHPFRSRCLLLDREVEPMNDCPRFERRPAEEEDAGASTEE